MQCSQGGQLTGQTGQQGMGMGAAAAGAAGAATAGAAATRDRSDRREDKAALKDMVRLPTVSSNDDGSLEHPKPLLPSPSGYQLLTQCNCCISVT